ncbi:MAG: hypothetical protein IJG45_02870 [Oscillospiraceae bacterium]|nr:hypothetical protein [Oscillospiraceae bacterium]
MEKIMIHITIPAIQVELDAFVPPDVEISRLTETMVEGIRELSNGRFGISGKELLMSQGPELLLNPQSTLEQYNLQDGARLVLI